MKKAIAFTIADSNNLKYAQMLEKTFKHFHKDIPFMIVQGEELAGYLKEDKDFFYRATAAIAEPLLKEYELVLKIDADSLILGDLSYVFDTKDYDIGTVINWNRVDPQTFGYVTIQGVQPPEYMNCGFVAMRNEKFVHDWNVLCHSPQFDRLQYKEQDLLNFMIYYGNWNVRCFDMPDPIKKYYAWHGLVAKSELIRAVVKDKKVIITKGEDNFPLVDTELKVWHVAGGNMPNKLNYKIRFTDEVSDYIDGILK